MTPKWLAGVLFCDNIEVCESQKNIIEGLNRQFRQITKNKPSFTNDDSLRKMLYISATDTFTPADPNETVSEE